MSKKRYLNFLMIFLLTICFSYEASSATTFATPFTISFTTSSTSPTTPRTNGNSTISDYRKSSSGGLSTGGIVAIVVPCVAALIGVGVAAALLKAPPAIPMQQISPGYDTSLDKIVSPTNEVIVHQPVQPVLVQQPVQPVQVVQPVQAVQPVPQQFAVVQEVVNVPVQVVENVPYVEQIPTIENVPVNNVVLQGFPAQQNVVYSPNQNSIIYKN